MPRKVGVVQDTHRTPVRLPLSFSWMLRIPQRFACYRTARAPQLEFCMLPTAPEQGPGKTGDYQMSPIGYPSARTYNDQRKFPKKRLMSGHGRKPQSFSSKGASAESSQNGP